MNNNLSKQLCELGGIEPKCVNCGQTVSDENPCPKPCNKQKYPDFAKPENFVRLLKIANDVLGGVHFATAYTKNKPHIFEEQALIHYLPIAKLNNSFQRAIREVEWVYE